MTRSNAVRRPKQAAAETAAHLKLDRAPNGQIDLVFSHSDRLRHVSDAIWQDVSCLAVAGRTVFCTCDETSTVERLFREPGSAKAGEHANFALGEVFDLPEGPEGEMDIEGLAIADGYLWICGSHSLKRDKPDDDGLAAMAELDWDANRGFLGRVPLIDRGEGRFEPVARIEPMGEAAGRAARMLPMRKKPDTVLRALLSEDPLIGRFVGLPCKENGLDIEGLAVRGNTVLLGLRGPVLGGLALIVRLEMKATKGGALKLRKLDGGGRYRLQAVDLNGQGIRDLCWQGDRLLILSGATTDLEALQSVFAIEDYDPDREIYPAEALRRVLDLPVRRGSDHAEGLAVADIDGAPKLVIAFDSPHDDRTQGKNETLRVDCFEIGDGLRPPRAPRRRRQASPRARA